jgi:hypothetical protein
MRFAFIQAERAQFGVARLCRASDFVQPRVA